MTSNHTNQLFEHLSRITTIGIFAWTLALIACLAVGISGYSFINPAFNSLLSHSLFLWPTVVFIFLIPSKLPAVLKIIGCGVFLPISLIMLLALLMTGPDIGTILLHEADPADQLIRSIPLGHTRIAVYRTNGGATTDFGVDVVQQRFVLPGIKYSKSLDYAYHASDAELTPIDTHHVKCHLCPTGSSTDSEDTTINDQ